EGSQLGGVVVVVELELVVPAAHELTAYGLHGDLHHLEARAQGEVLLLVDGRQQIEAFADPLAILCGQAQREVGPLVIVAADDGVVAHPDRVERQEGRLAAELPVVLVGGGDAPEGAEVSPHHLAEAGAHGGPDEPEQRSEEHTSELQSRENLVCRLLLEKKNRRNNSRRG